MKPVGEKPLRNKRAWFVLLWAGGFAAAVAVGYAAKRVMATEMVMQF